MSLFSRRKALEKALVVVITRLLFLDLVTIATTSSLIPFLEKASLKAFRRVRVEKGAPLVLIGLVPVISTSLLLAFVWPGGLGLMVVQVPFGTRG